MARQSDAPERLLAAALDLLWTSSYGAVGVDDICEKANVRKGSFYHFFASKADLALAAYEAHWRMRQPEYDATFSPLVPPLERIFRWCGNIERRQMELHSRYGFVCGCPYVNIGAELGTQDERLRAKSEELIQRMVAYLESAVSDAQRMGFLPSDTPALQLARELQSCAIGQVLMAKVHNDPSLLKDLKTSVSRLLGVSALPAAA